MPYSSTFPKVCEYVECQSKFEAKKPKIRFCSKQCATSARITPESREVSRTTMNEIRQRPDVQAKLNQHLFGETNPFRDPEMIAKAKEAQRVGGYWMLNGGNGREPSDSQLILFKGIGEGAIIEHPIRTRMKRGSGYPSNYKVDIAIPFSMVAIEIHGNSHRSHASKARDEKKKKKLEELGWTVVSYWNEDVHRNLDRILTEINALISRKEK